MNPLAPGPERLTLVTSPDDCNLACGMCRGHSPHAPARRGARRRLPARAALDALATPWTGGVREVVPSTMGEPLLWDGLEELARACALRGVALNGALGDFGPAGAAAWRSEAYRALVDGYESRDTCRACAFRRPGGA